MKLKNKKKTSLFIVATILTVLIGCVSRGEDVNVINQLERKYDSDFKERFKSVDGRMEVSNYMDTLTGVIINFLKKDTVSQELFERYEILEEFDQSRIIIYQWYKQLNREEYSFEDHLKRIYNSKDK